MKKKIIFWLVCFFAVVLLGAWLGFRLASSWGPGGRTVVVGPTLLKEVQKLNEWTCVRSIVQTVVAVSESHPPLGEEKLVLIVCGRVEAGIKMSELKPSDVHVDEKNRTVEVILPAPVILRCYIDDKNTQVWERTKAWFIPYNPKMDQEARQDALVRIQDTAVKIGTIDQARINAEANMRGLLHTMGFEDKNITVRSRD